jgi:hypothetical protein
MADPTHAFATRMRVLEQMQQSLEQTLAQSSENPTPLCLAATAPTAPAAELLARLDARLAQLRESVQHAEERTADLDILLAAGAEHAERWLAGARDWKQRLAKPIPRSV